MGTLGSPEIVSLVLVALVVTYLLSLKRFLEKCSPESRAVSPRSVWLMLIPLFNWIWHFVLVIKISKTLHNELTRRNLPDTESESSKRLGIIMCTLGVLAGLLVGRILSPDGPIEAVPAICVSAFLVWLVVYWRKITACSKLLDADSEVGQGRPDSAADPRLRPPN